MSSKSVLTASIIALAALRNATPAFAQSQGYETFRREAGRALTAQQQAEPSATSPVVARQNAPTDYNFKNRADSLSWVKYRALAAKSTGFRVVVSLQEFHLWVITDEDTLLSAPVATGKGTTLSYGGYEKTFQTPRGPRRVLGKDADPIWTPPEWLYYETAAEYGLQIKRIPNSGLTMPDGKRLVVQDGKIGVIDSLGPTDFPVQYHIIFDKTLYIPPVGTENRKVKGTLGKYKLELGEGYLFHGTPEQGSIGMAATHGCIRLRDEDIEWLYENIPVGTKVYIY